ncbi:MAG: hydrogenase iron-sulfur subunit, partial [Candidatus Heimdallarchaeota archaeon]
AQIHGIFEGDDTSPKILAFLEGTTAYGCVDLAGQTRLSYPPNVRIIRVPSTGRINVKHLLYAFSEGADGIVFIEGYDSVFDENRLRDHVIRIKKDLQKFGVKSLRLMSTPTTLPQCNKIVKLFQTFNERISKMGLIPEEKRQELRENLGGL